jgi:ADP-ribosylglycohydrolase
MRVAPVGAYFSDDLRRAADEAQRSAVITHAHDEAQAGAIAVAVAAAIADRERRPSGNAFIEEVLEYVPDGITRRRLQSAMKIPSGNLGEAARTLGSGYKVSAQDTVPFCLWCAAHHLDNFEEALRWTVRGQGDCDTTCAIVGGIVAMSASTIPALWLERREALPPI